MAQASRWSVGKGFLKFMASQLVSSIGDALLAVASAMLLVGITGSGLYAGIGAMFPPLCGLVASSLAGSLGDRYPEKYLLIGFGLVKGALFILLVFAKPLWLCYVILFLISLANVFYGIPARKLTSALLPPHRLLAGNSMLNGVSGAAFFIGPVLAGAAVQAWGSGAVLAGGGLFHVLSSLFLAGIAMLPHAQAGVRPGGGLSRQIRDGAAYCMKNTAIRQAILAFAVIAFGSAATGLAFYPYAFDTLKAGPYEWGAIVSVFNGATLVSTVFPALAEKWIGKSYGVPVFICCLFIADAWFSYSLCGSFAGVLPLLAVEGTFFCLSTTLLTTRLQLSSDRNRLARVLGTSDLAVSLARLIGMGASAAAILFAGPSAVFIACGAALAAFALWGLLRVMSKRRLRSVGSSEVGKGDFTASSP